MRLSDIKGPRSFEVIADVIDPLCNIAEDAHVQAFFQKVDKLPKGQTIQELFLKRLRANLPAIIRDHKNDFMAIMAAINGVAVEEYASVVTPISLINDILVLFNDPVAAALFNMAEKGVSSGSAMESIEE